MMDWLAAPPPWTVFKRMNLHWFSHVDLRQLFHARPPQAGINSTDFTAGTSHQGITSTRRVQYVQNNEAKLASVFRLFVKQIQSFPFLVLRLSGWNAAAQTPMLPTGNWPGHPGRTHSHTHSQASISSWPPSPSSSSSSDCSLWPSSFRLTSTSLPSHYLPFNMNDFISSGLFFWSLWVAAVVQFIIILLTKTWVHDHKDSDGRHSGCEPEFVHWWFVHLTLLLYCCGRPTVQTCIFITRIKTLDSTQWTSLKTLTPWNKMLWFLWLDRCYIMS